MFRFDLLGPTSGRGRRAPLCRGKFQALGTPPGLASAVMLNPANRLAVANRVGDDGWWARRGCRAAG